MKKFQKSLFYKQNKELINNNNYFKYLLTYLKEEKPVYQDKHNNFTSNLNNDTSKLNSRQPQKKNVYYLMGGLNMIQRITENQYNLVGVLNMIQRITVN